jgi:hypothetical protein
VRTVRKGTIHISPCATSVTFRVADHSGDARTTCVRACSRSEFGGCAARSCSTRIDHQLYCDVAVLSSASNAAWRRATPRQLLHRPLVQRIARTQVLRRDLSSLELVALMIDGVALRRACSAGGGGDSRTPAKTRTRAEGRRDRKKRRGLQGWRDSAPTAGVTGYNMGPQRAVIELNPFVGRKVADAAVVKRFAS